MMKIQTMIASGDAPDIIQVGEASNSYASKNISVDGVFEGNAFDGKLTVNDPNAIVNMAGKFDFLSKHPYAKFPPPESH